MRTCSTRRSASRVRDHLADLDLIEGHRVGHPRGDLLADRPRGILRLEEDHRKARVVLARPVAGHEARRVRRTRNDLLLQCGGGGIEIADGHLTTTACTAPPSWSWGRCAEASGVRPGPAPWPPPRRPRGGSPIRAR